MKIKLLLSLSLISAIAFSQHQVNSFYGPSGAVSGLFTSAAPLNHGTGGADQTWTFGSLVFLGLATYTYAPPTAGESTTYPGTNNVIITTSVEGATTTTGKMFTKNTAGNVSITGLDASGLTLNFNGSSSAGNATLGTFPLVYPYTNTDTTVSGTYNYTTYSGTFTGNLITTVDGYGVLNLPDFTYSGNVTRLKTVLTLSLNYSIFTNVGTVTQTSYTYYDPANTSNSFEFRSVNLVALIPLAGIDQNTTSLERGNFPILANEDNILGSVWIQNPIQNTIEINTSNTIENASISITDMLGKTIYQTQNQTITGTLEIPVWLTKGMYLITIDSENGSITKKIVKS
jgi:hypothetical protein